MILEWKFAEKFEERLQELVRDFNQTLVSDLPEVDKLVDSTIIELIGQANLEAVEKQFTA